jgi:hypothetical protein
VATHSPSRYAHLPWELQTGLKFAQSSTPTMHLPSRAVQRPSLRQISEFEQSPFVEATQRSRPFNEHSPLSLQPGVSRQSTAPAPASATEASGAAALGSATRRAKRGEPSPKSMLRILFPASAIGKRQAATKRRRLFSR